MNMRQRSFMSPLFQRHQKQQQQQQQQQQHANRTHNNNGLVDDADAAAGQKKRFLSTHAPPPPPSNSSLATLNTNTHPSDLEFFEDLVSEPVLVLGVDISHFTERSQFVVCATGVFGFSLLYGYLQELLSVTLCSRQLGLFLAMMQFLGYTVLAYVLRTVVYRQQHTSIASTSDPMYDTILVAPPPTVPLMLYFGLSMLRAIDLGMTNLAMQYLNYPAKTLMKSSRIVMVMLFGVLIQRKRYKLTDYGIVLAMVGGLALFMHADASNSAVFDVRGVVMLTISLLCDGAISNMSESIMNQFGVGQDEFIFRMYSIAFVAISAAAATKGDLQEGLRWMAQPGTYAQIDQPELDRSTWSVPAKIAVMTLFSSMGFFGSSCSAAITKNFGALTMSITSTARKATTLFLSFFIFHNVCTLEHVAGVAIFMVALTTKSLRRGRDKRPPKKRHSHLQQKRIMPPSLRLSPARRDVDMGGSDDGFHMMEVPSIVQTRSVGSDGTPQQRRRPPNSRDLMGIHVV